MYTTEQVLGLKPQKVRIVYEASKQYADTVDLTLGDPDIPAPTAVIEATAAAMRSGKTKYTSNRGILPLREAIGRDVERRTGIRYNPGTEITVTAGAMGALFLASRAILAPGDEMIVVEPNWPNYINMIRMCGAEAVPVSIYGEGQLFRRIERAITPKTRAVILNSPSNPTGLILSLAELRGVAELAKKHGIYVISDEVYRSIVFDGECHSILELPGMKERCILVDSFSKRFSMTGFRVGFLCAPEEVAGYAADLEENVNSCACMFAQEGALEALLQGENAEREIRDIFRDRCLRTAEELNRSCRLNLPVPAGTFYLFVDVSATGLSSEEFSMRLLRETHIAVVPGNAFGDTGEGYIRIACTLPTEKLVTAAKRIVAFAEAVRNG